ncbi:MAG: Nramp family divalent metal transporter [Flavobacteriaceae bacterium]|nr:Nramp family divalent metal transporter [Flavobacteriaceae bacterium]
MNKLSFNSGPAIVVTAAFIGPGSLTVCAIAGVEFGYELLWAVLLSCMITIFFQNTVAHLSFKSGQGLVELFNNKLNSSISRYLFTTWVLVAIFIGNAAYEAGNISGAYIGLKKFIELSSFNTAQFLSPFLNYFIAITIIFLVWNESNRLIKNILGFTVFIMSVSFFFAAILTKPSLYELLKGFLIPRWRPEIWKTIIAVLGTTIVPYNLFLHAALVKHDLNRLQFSFLKRDTIIAVSFGGLISSAIIISAAGAEINQINSINDLGNALYNLYGPNSQIFISIGLFTAGLSSAITAPIAAGYVVEESFIKNENRKNLKKIAIYFVIITGLAFTVSGYNPIELIRAAQVANGLLLPGIALFISILCFPKKDDILIIKIRFLGLLILFLFFTVLAAKVLFL